MPSEELSKLELVPVRNIWKDEALDFTPWLAENLHQLGEALHLDLELVQQEAQAGDFYLDILAREVGSQRQVAIENQLEMTDHSHLGQILTYAAGHEACYLIWVSPYFRDEHRAAIDWLNRWTVPEIEAYGVEISAVRIGDSPAAPQFHAVAFPNNWTNRLKQTSSGTSPRNLQYRDFFQPMMEELHDKGFTDRTYTRARSYQAFPTTHPWVSYHLSFWNSWKGNEAEAVAGPLLWISTGDRDDTNRIFDRLQTQYKEDIEEDLGAELLWDRYGNHPWAMVALARKAAIDDSPQELAVIRAWMLEQFPRFRDAVKPMVELVLGQIDSEDTGHDEPDSPA